MYNIRIWNGVNYKISISMEAEDAMDAFWDLCDELPEGVQVDLLHDGYDVEMSRYED